MDFHTIELFAGVGQLGEGLRSGLGYLGITARPVAYVEREAYAAAVLASRIQEGSLDAAPVWSDVTTFDAGRWAGAVDCVVAGFPCQDLSLAGRRAGLDGKRSGLFFEVVRIARDCGARYLFLENVAGIASATATVVDEAEGTLDERAAARVLGELADLGWHAEWVTLSAADVGASHGRARWFCWAWRAVGHTGWNAGSTEHGQQPQSAGGWAGKPGAAGDSTAVDDAESRGMRVNQQDQRASTGNGDGFASASDTLGNAGLQHQHLQQREDGAEHPGAGSGVADADSARSQGGGYSNDQARRQEQAGHAGLESRGIFAPGPADPAWPGIIQHWPHLAPALEPSFYRVVDGLAHRMDDCRAQRLKCCGNGVVAAQAAFALVGLVRRMMEAS